MSEEITEEAPKVIETTEGNGKWYESRKLWYGVMAIAAVLAIFLGGTAIGLSEMDKEQAVNAVKWIAGFLLGGHAITDVASRVRREG